MPRITLFHDWDSLQSFKVRLCLSEIGVDWDSKIVSLAHFDNLKPDYLALNPLGVVPTLIAADNDIIPESSVINEYLNEVYFDAQLLPESAIARAHVRLWARFEDDVVHPATRLATFNLMLKQRVRRMPPEVFEALIAQHPWPERAAAYRKAATSNIDPAQVKEAVQKFQAICNRMDAALTTSKWLAGESYSLADIAMTPFVDRVERLGMGQLWRNAHALRDWIMRVRSRASYWQSVAPADKRMPAPDPAVVAVFL